MGRKQSFKPNQIRCLIYVSGMNADSTANRIEQYAYEHDLTIVDTLIKEGPDIRELEYYLEKDSIEAVLLRSIEDISTNKKEIQKLLIMAANHGISVNCENMDYEPVTVNFEGDV